MTRRGLAAVAACCCVTLAGCGGIGESRLNPLNWFGGAERSAPVVTSANDPRGLVQQVVSLRIESVPGGAILHATGLPPRQGFFDGDVIPVGAEVAQNGVLNYEFRINQPVRGTRVGPQPSREVVVGRFMSEQTLLGVRQIRVSGASNALVVRR